MKRASPHQIDAPRVTQDVAERRQRQKRVLVTASWKALTDPGSRLSGATANWRAIVGSATVDDGAVEHRHADRHGEGQEGAGSRCRLGRPSCASTARGAGVGSRRFKAIQSALRGSCYTAVSRRPAQIVGVGALDLDALRCRRRARACAVAMCTAPSICGESPLVRPLASRAPPSSNARPRGACRPWRRASSWLIAGARCH